VLWAGFTLGYFAQLLITRRLFEDLRHPRQGPFAAYIPVIGILLTVHYEELAPTAMRSLMLIFVIALALVAAALLRHWIIGDVPFSALHPGYLLPVVAGPFLASIGLTSAGLTTAAWAAFGVGAFFWVAIGTLILSRLITGAPLPVKSQPSVSILMSPPAAAGLAWIIARGSESGLVFDSIIGVLVLMGLLQLFMLRDYVRAPFSLSYWALTFPVCAGANLAIRLLSDNRPSLWRELSVGAVTLSTTVVFAVGVATLARVIPWRGAKRRPGRRSVSA
jgi:tellurite resistance protein